MNSLTPLMYKILVNAAMHLRKTTVMPRLVNNDIQAATAQKGNTIDVMVHDAAAVAKDVVPSVTAPQPPDKTAKTVPVTLDNWKYQDFYMSDKDMAEIDAKKFFLPDQAINAVISLAEAINTSILGEYKRIPTLVGVPGVNPFTKDATLNVDGDQYVIDARQQLTTQMVPKNNRALVMDLVSEGKALSLQTIKDANTRGDQGRTKTTGEIINLYGFDWYADQTIPRHVTGTLSNGSTHTALINGALALGATIMSIDSTTLTGTIVTGDIFTVAGDTQQYVVTSGPHTASGNAVAGITFSPAIKATAGWADNAVVTFVGSHTVNLAFHKNAFAFANRILSDSTFGGLFKGGQLMETYTDDGEGGSGLTFRLTVMRGFMQTQWYFDILWGTRLVQPELATRMAGL